MGWEASKGLICLAVEHKNVPVNRQRPTALIQGRLKQLIFSALLGIAAYALSEFFIYESSRFVDIGWHFLTISYIAIFLCQLAFYYFTFLYKLTFTFASFILNFCIWIVELVSIFALLETVLPREEHFRLVLLYLIAGLLWGANKIVLDAFLSTFIDRRKHTSSPSS